MKALISGRQIGARQNRTHMPLFTDSPSYRLSVQIFRECDYKNTLLRHSRLAFHRCARFLSTYMTQVRHTRL